MYTMNSKEEKPCNVRLHERGELGDKFLMLSMAW
jgi:hypothetical protein